MNIAQCLSLKEQSIDNNGFSVETMPKAFIGFKINNSYDFRRLKIPDDFEPIYYTHNNENYYGVWVDFNDKGQGFYDFVTDLRLSNVTSKRNVMDISLEEFKINTLDSYRYISDNVIALSFEEGVKFVDDTYSKFDTIVYTESKLPPYIKVSAMYIFMFFN